MFVALLLGLRMRIEVRNKFVSDFEVYHHGFQAFHAEFAALAIFTRIENGKSLPRKRFINFFVL